jgi:hypothetical protein
MRFPRDCGPRLPYGTDTVGNTPLGTLAIKLLENSKCSSPYDISGIKQGSSAD